eukprot:4202951-Amphidinium_carterae.1
MSVCPCMWGLQSLSVNKVYPQASKRIYMDKNVASATHNVGRTCSVSDQCFAWVSTTPATTKLFAS